MDSVSRFPAVTTPLLLSTAEHNLVGQHTNLNGFPRQIKNPERLILFRRPEVFKRIDYLL
jgi:hypothetical protein